jgi:protein-S-isoprenylcysteine O-methyltransferase Ste14
MTLPTTQAGPAIARGLMRRFLLRTAIWLLIIAALLFGAAGTLDWPGAWVYLLWSVAISFGGGYWLSRRDPGLLAERLGPIVQRDQKAWDKVFMIVVFAVWLGWIALMGLDIRYGWSRVPLAVQLAGLVLLCLGGYLVGLTFKANSFAAPVVKIQTERQHRVIDSGPYAYVRHPMYSGVLLITAGAPLLLGSWWGLLAGALFVFLIGLRAVLEERTLKAELKGYSDYAAKVRYQLVPYLW